MIGGTAPAVDAQPTDGTGPPDRAAPPGLDLRNRRPDTDVVNALLERIAVEGSAQIVVGLPVLWHPDAALDAPTRANERAIEARAKGRLLRSLSDLPHDVIHGYDDFIPFVALEVGMPALRQLARSPHVATIEPVEVIEPLLDDSVHEVGASRAWSSGYDGSGQTVAIIDTGVDASHPTFGGRVVEEACFSWAASCPNGGTVDITAGAAAPCTWDDDACSHGTHVAGIAAGEQPRGVAPGADIVAIQAFSRYVGSSCGAGGGPCALASSGDYIRALQWLHEIRDERPVAAVNMSLGGGYSQFTCDRSTPAGAAAVAQLHAEGTAVVVASGNGRTRDGVASPACLSQVVRVGNATTDGRISQSSNSDDLISLVAPGSFIESAVPSGTEVFSGTSMAAPHVAGAWAIVKQAAPTASVPEVLGALTTSGRPITDARNGVTRPMPSIAAAIAVVGQAPPNDDRAAAETLSGATGVRFGMTANAGREDGEADHAGAGGASSIWYRWTAPADGIAAFDTLGSSFDTVIAVYDGTNELASNDNAQASVAQSRVELAVTSGTVYDIAVDGVGSAHGAVIVRWHFGPPENDTPATARVISGPTGSDSGTNLGATIEFPNPFPADVVGSVWYRWTAARDGRVAFDTAGSDYDTSIWLFSGPPGNLAHEGRAGSLGTEVLYADVVAGETYHIAVAGELSAGQYGHGSHILSWTQLQPSNATATTATRLTTTSGTIREHPVHLKPASGPRLWYRFTAPAAGTLMVDNHDSDTATSMTVWLGADPTDLARLDTATENGPQSTAEIGPIGLEAGETVHLEVVPRQPDAYDRVAVNWTFGAPPNDDFADSHPLESSAGDRTWTNLAAGSEAQEPTHGHVGGSSVWFTLRPNVDGLAIVRVEGLHATIGAYTGDSLTTLARVATSRDDTRSKPSLSRRPARTFVHFHAQAGVEYHIAIDGVGGATSDDFGLRWQVGPTNDDLADAIDLGGDEGEVMGDTTGSGLETGEDQHMSTGEIGGVWYAWTAPRDGVVVADVLEADGTPHVKVFTGTAIADLTAVATSSWRAQFDAAAGTTYLLRVSAYSSRDSIPGPFRLRWRYAPDHDDPATAQPLDGAVGTVVASNEGATKNNALGEAASPSSAGASVWYRWTAPASGLFTFDTIGSDHDTELTIYTGTGPDFAQLSEVATDNNGAVRHTSNLRLDAVEGTNYFVEVDGPGHKFCCSSTFSSSWVGTHRLTWAPTPVNDDVADATPLTGAAGPEHGTNVGATREADEPVLASATTGRSVWYRWTAPADGFLDLWIDADFDTLLAVHPAIPFVEMSPAGVDVRGHGGERIDDHQVLAGQEVLIVVAGYAGAGGEFDLKWVFEAINHPPVAIDQTVAARAGTEVEIVLEATDVDRDRLAYQIVSQPDHGQLYDGGVLVGRTPWELTSSSVVYVSDPLFSGTDEFEFRADDRQATSEPATVTIDVEGPDRDELAFTTDRDGNREVYLWRDDESPPTNLTGTGINEDNPVFSPDGRTLAFVRSDRIHLLDLGSGVESGPLVDMRSGSPAWAPDGAQIAFQADDGNGDWEIFAVHVPTGEVRRITDNAVDDFYPDWSPDGDALVVAAGSPRYLTIIDARDGSVRSRHIGAGVARYPEWSPAGDLIAYSQARSGGWSLSLLDPATDTVVQMVDDGATNFWPAWSASGDRIAFAARTAFSEPWHLRVLTVSDRSVTTLSEPGPGWEPDWRP